MKKRTSKVSRRIVSLLMSIVLTLTLVTPAAFAEGDMPDNGQQQEQQEPTDAGNGGSGDVSTPAGGKDSESKDDESKNTEDKQQPADPGDEDKNPNEGDGEDANKPAEDNKGEEKPDEDKKDEENKDKQSTEDENNGEDEIALLDAENGTDVWDGKIAGKFAGGTGTESDPYQISNGAQLAYLAQQVNAGTNYSGEYFKLTSDIRLNADDVPTGGNEWTPIGKSDNSFNGIFDGAGHTISGLYVPDTTGCPGLFGMGDDDTVIRDLIVVGTICAGESAKDAYVGVGGICAASYGKVQNCGFYGTIKADDSVYDELPVGGIAGGFDTTVEKCWYFDTDGNSKVDGVSSCDSIIGCYHNVSGSKSGEYKENGEFTNGTVASLLNASLPKGYKMWKPGTKHPEFLQTGEKLVVLEKFLPTTDVQVKVNDADYALVDASTNSVKLMGENAFYKASDGQWKEITKTGVDYTLGDGQVTTIVYGSKDDTTADNWYKKEGAGTADMPYELGNTAELVYFAKLVNEGNPFNGKYIQLTKNIALNAQDVPTADGEPTLWTPIGTYVSRKDSKPFSGTFDGNGHAITGLYINNAAQYQGLFGNISTGGVVKNLAVAGRVIATGQNNVGGIVARLSGGTVQNCGFYGAVTAGTSNAGGVVGQGSATNCWYYRTDDGASVLGVYGSWSGINCYTNVNKSVSGTTVCTETQFKDGTVADLLNPYAYENGLPLWKVGSSYLNIDTALKYDALVKLTTGVKNSTVAGKVGFGSSLVQSKLTNSGDALTLATAEGTGDVRYTVKNPQGDGVTITEADLVPTSTPYTVKAEDVDEQGTITLYFGTKDELMADLAESGWYYNQTSKSYTIKTSEELHFLATLVNDKHIDFSGKTITLNADIDLSGIKDWAPIGKDADHPFKGTFNGNRKVISGLTVTGDYANAGLFGVVDGGTIQGVTVKNGKVTSAAAGANVGGIVGWLKSGGVYSCACTAEVSGSGQNAVIGGLVGKNDSTNAVDTGYCYGTEDLKPVGVGMYTNCYYMAKSSTYDKKDTDDDTGARTQDEFDLGRVAYELGWGYDTTAQKKLPVLSSYVYAEELTLTKPANLQDGVDVTIGNDSDKRTLTGTDGKQYFYAASGADVPLTIKGIPAGQQIVFLPYAPVSTDDGLALRVKPSAEYTYSLVEADISWYENSKDTKTYAFKNAKELVGLSLLVNGELGKYESFAGWELSLEQNIALTNIQWAPIGVSNSFDGTFNGNNHTITGLNVDAAKGYAGLFGWLKGTVQNLQVQGSAKASGSVSYIGGVVGYNDGGTVKNCLNAVSVNAEGTRASAGGVVGNSTSVGVVNLCWNEGSVTGGSTTGGIVGKAAGSVTNCANFGAVTSSGTAGGIAGSGTVANSYNLGSVTGAANKAYGISSGTVVNSYYICTVGTDERSGYIKNGKESTGQNIIAASGEHGKVIYTVGTGDDAQELVEVLNTPENLGIYIEWTNKTKSPYNPIHIRRWDGSFEEGIDAVTLIYDPNGATTGRAVEINRTVAAGAESAVFQIKSVEDTDLGFKHENGTFLGWDEKSNAATPGYKFDASKGTITPAEISVKKGETVTLYAMWQNIWDTDADGAYLIKTPDDLQSLQTQVNDKGFNYKSKWFRLANDIDMKQFDNWTPIGIVGNAFAGNLDGGTYSIRNLSINTTNNNANAGLFGEVSGSTFQKLTLKDVSVTGRYYCGSLVGSLATNGVGITLVDITAKNIQITSSSGNAGGLVGYCPNINAKNCTVENGSSVVGYNLAAGICTAGSSGSSSITACHSSAEIKTTYTGTASGRGIAAGIVACATNNTGFAVTGCTNSGMVSGQNFAAGIATAGRITDCVNSGEVTSVGKLAGGISNNAFNVERCGNTGTITGYAERSSGTGVAGINNFNGASFCYNTGKVISTYKSDWAYGISGTGNNSVKLKNCFSYVAGEDIALAPNTLADGKVTNSYYLASSATAVSSAGEYATLSDFASGKVAWGVGGKGEGSQGGTGQDAQLGWWKQDKDDKYPTLLATPDMSKRYYRTDVDCGTGGEVELTRNSSSAVKELSSKEAVYGPAGTSVTIKATPKDNTYALKSMTVQLPVGTAAKSISNPGTFTMPNEGNVLVTANFGSATPGGGGGYYYGGSGDGTGTGDKDDEGLQDGLNMDVEYNIKGLVLGAYAEWGANGGNKSFQKWLEENPNVVRALLTNSLDNMATAAVGKKTDEAKDLAALLLASLNEHTGVDSKDGDTIAKALQKYIGSGSEEVFSAWLTAGGGMASGTYESIYGQYASSLAALADRLYSKWEASGTSMTFPVWLDAQQVSMDSLSENAEEPDTDNTNDPQTSDAPDDVPDGQDTEGGASGNSVWEVIGTVVRENPIIVWSIVAVIAALIIVGAVRRYHKVKRDERDEK